MFYSGVGPILLNQLKNCKDKSYLSVALFFAGNLCGEDKCRNILVSSGIIEVVLQLLNKVLASLHSFILSVSFEPGDHGELRLLPSQRRGEPESSPEPRFIASPAHPITLSSSFDRSEAPRNPHGHSERRFAACPIRSREQSRQYRISRGTDSSSRACH